MGAAGSIGAGLLQAGSSIMSGRAQSRALANEAVQYDAQAKGVDLQSTQSSERRREDFRALMAGITANRAARNLSLDTPSAIAIEKELRRQAVRDEGVERLGFINDAAGLRAAARARRRGASAANVAGYMGAATSIMSTAADVSSARGISGGSKLPGGAQKKDWSL